ncbi:pyridoxal phosphate-dependent transferase [Triangularia verruculosa]|uniref:Pyridoxal phosphate-dependent transferase n=1 Tax=Triangularia verruculosa TaxID=2587418 RepID=A0AAN6XM03_9PEZI|nr:pyridoxal phosphate-dependent transferase [Triangularia verruculosa]
MVVVKMPPTASNSAMSNSTNTSSVLHDITNQSLDPDRSVPGSKKGLINFLRGWPSPSLLSPSILQSATTALLSDPALFVPALQYGPDPGYQPLREELAVWLGQQYSTKTRSEEICITGGASQGLACVLASFTDPAYTQTVWASAPCYYLACPIFEDAGFGPGRINAVPEDQQGGMDIALLETLLQKYEPRQNVANHRERKTAGPYRKHYRHVVYLVSTCSNPSGTTMPLEKRKALVELARRYDVLVVSDDVYDFLQWPIVTTPTKTSFSPEELGPLLPRLSDVDLSLPSLLADITEGRRFGNAISNGSFSKLLGPGLRTGWVHGTPDFITGLSQTGATRSGGAGSQFAAALVAEVMKAGELERHLRETVRPGLQRRHGLLIDVIQQELGPLGVTVAAQDGARFGGYFVWLTLPEGLDGKMVAQRARQDEELIVAEGEMFEVRGDDQGAKFRENIRLSFSWEEEQNLKEGVGRLGNVLGALVGKK